MDTKEWWQSKIIWTAVATVVAQLLRLTGHAVSDGDVQLLGDAVANLAAVVGPLVIMKLRTTSTTPIMTKDASTLKSIAVLCCGALLMSLGGCATFSNNQASEKLLTQYAVMKVIEADKNHMHERAAKIKEIATAGKSFFDTGTATVDMLAVEIQKRIRPIDLSPSDRMLANALVDTVVAELKSRVDTLAPGGVPPSEAVYQVSTVLSWVVDATEFY